MSLMIFTPTWVTSEGVAMDARTRESIEMQKMRPSMASAPSAPSASSGTGGIEWVIGTDNPYQVGSHRNVLHQYQNAQRLFLASGHEALLTVEHDNVLPDSGAAQRLMDTDADVVYGLYVLRHGNKVLNAWRYDNDRNVGMPLNRYPTEMRDARKAGVWRVSGIGMGCTLFRRHVLEKIAFRGGGEGFGAPDVPFAWDALQARMLSMCRFDVEVGHIESGTMLMPFGGNGVEKKQYIVKQSANASAAGQWMRLIEGEAVMLTEEEARELMSIGLVMEAGEQGSGGAGEKGGEVEEAVIAPAEVAVSHAQRVKRKR